MSEELDIATPVAGINAHPEETEAGSAEASAEAVNSDKVATPKVEQRDGKLFVDGVRVYTRDDTNRIAANAKRELESKMLSELQVESFDQVREVVGQLQSAGDDSGSLNVESLRDAVKKREQTVEELRAELSAVKTEMNLKEHIGKINESMPAQWSQDQRSAVVDLMKSRNMLHLDGDSFAIRNGDDFLTVDGETPDYAAAVNIMGKTLGLPMAKQGVATFDSDRKPESSARTATIDEARIKSDSQYRQAYIQIRERNKGLSRSEITDSMIRKQMEGTTRASGSERMLYGAPSNTNSAKTTKTRRR